MEPTMAFGVATIAIGVASAVVGGVTVVWKMSSKFVTHDQCSQHIVQCGHLRDSKRETSDQHIEMVSRELADLRRTTERQHREAKASSQIQYYMLRSLVAHMPNLTPDQQAKILNGGNGKGRRHDD